MATIVIILQRAGRSVASTRDVISGTSAMTLCPSVSDSSRSFIETDESMGACLSITHRVLKKSGQL